MKALVRSHVNPLDAAWSLLKSLPDDRLREFAESIGQDRPAETGTLYGAPLSETITPYWWTFANIDEEGMEEKMREQAEGKDEHTLNRLREAITPWAKKRLGDEPARMQRAAQRWLETTQRHEEGAPLRRWREVEHQPRTFHGSVARPGMKQHADAYDQFIAENAPGP